MIAKRIYGLRTNLDEKQFRLSSESFSHLIWFERTYEVIDFQRLSIYQKSMCSCSKFQKNRKRMNGEFRQDKRNCTNPFQRQRPFPPLGHHEITRSTQSNLRSSGFAPHLNFKKNYIFKRFNRKILSILKQIICSQFGVQGRKNILWFCID